MILFQHAFLFLLLFAAACLLGAAPPARADDVENINWAYQETLPDGLYFGTHENAQIFDLPLSFTLRHHKEKPWGVKLKVPITVGVYNLESEDARLDLNVLAFVPGLEFQIPVRDNWLLMPLGNFGIGKEKSGGSLHYIYSVGIKHHVFFRWRQFDFTYGNAYRYSGFFTGGGGAEGSYSSFDTGLDMRFPLGFDIFGKKALLSVFGVNYYFFEDETIVDTGTSTLGVRSQWEVGITFSTDPTWKVWFFEIERLGLGYRFGGDLNAVRLVFGMPF
jgi:hypothetical protein